MKQLRFDWLLLLSAAVVAMFAVKPARAETAGEE